MARIRGKSHGPLHDQMVASVMEEAQHWLDVAAYAGSERRTDVESMALARVAQLERVAAELAVAL